MSIRDRSRIRLAALTFVLFCGDSVAHGQAVFNGDPIDPTSGQPYTLLPGLPLVSPGADGRFNTSDDGINPGIVGDVDLVVRSNHSIAGAVIPAPAAGVAAAPAVAPGGLYSGSGTEVDFQAIVSDGAATPAVGNPQPSADLDGRGIFVVAYADLDGDGVIGPWDGDGSSDDQLELQELYTPVGRQVAVLRNGVASGTLGVTAGAPGSVGGLGVLLVAGATTGSAPPIYLDGTWIATRLPFMPPIDAEDVVGHGGGVRPPDPDELVEVKLDVEFAPEEIFLPAPGHPQLGTSYAIPTDGSSVTNDVVRAESNNATGIGIARGLDTASYVAVPGRRLSPIVNDTGARLVVEAIDLLALADDGPGNGIDLWVYPADLLGNAADPLFPLQTTIEVGPALRIVSPDTDANPTTETLVFSGPEAMPITIDDAGGDSDGASGQYLTALLGGVPSIALRAELAATQGPLLSFDVTRSLIKKGRKTGKGIILVKADLTADPTQIDLVAIDVALTLAAAGVVYTRTFPAGSFLPKGSGWLYREGPSVSVGRVTKFLIRADRDPGRFRLKFKAKDLNLDSFDPRVATVTNILRIDGGGIDSTIPCRANKMATITLCAP